MDVTQPAWGEIPTEMPNTLPIPKVTDALLRAATLEAAHADGDLFQVWRHFSVVAGRHRAWVAQDDYLPPPGEEDPIPREWRDVLKLLWVLGYGDVGEPAFDTVTEAWLWVVER